MPKKNKTKTKKGDSKNKSKGATATEKLKSQLSQISHELDSLITGVQSQQTFVGSGTTVFFDIGNTLLVPDLGGGNRWMWAPSAKDTVTTMKANGVSVGIISNTGSLSRPELTRLFPTGFFDVFDEKLTVLSSEVSHEKPELAIFYVALARTAQPPASCLFVGENRTEVMAAQRVGMRAFRIADFASDFQFVLSLRG